MQRGFFYDFSNYGSYERLQKNGITQWHPAFLKLGTMLDLHAAIYRKFCHNYRPKAKSPKESYWGSQGLEKLKQQIKPQKAKP